MMNQGAKKAGYVSQPAAMDPRSTEAWALSEASRRLVVAAKAEDGGKSLRDALILNQRLWTIFQTSMTEPDCPLPREIRDNVLALSIMMDRQILQRLGDLDGSRLQPILDINRCVAEGLAMKPQVPEAGVAQGVQAVSQQPMPAAPVTGGTRMAVNVSA
jgi:flagellar protein FlaF